tara:strand:- start:843 stop:1727 length:885 start_codon:yes stop_codon:yes gene_type:complete
MKTRRQILKETIKNYQTPKKSCSCGCGGCGQPQHKSVLLDTTSPISEGLRYHIDNGIPLRDNVFKMGSKKYLQLFAEARMLYKWGNISLDDDSKHLVENTNIGKFGILEGKKVPLDIHLLTENEDKEEAEFDNEFDSLGDDLAGAIESELEDKKDELNEAVGVVGILGYILLSNTVANMLSKFAKNQFAKRDWGKGEEAAKKIEKWTHNNEVAFKAPIKRVVGLFTKNEKWKTTISDILYAIVILLMAGQAGGNAVGYIKKAGYLKGGLYGLKSLVKGTEVAQILKGVVSDIAS